LPTREEQFLQISETVFIFKEVEEGLEDASADVGTVDAGL
jgi:hypothetical protein